MNRKLLFILTAGTLVVGGCAASIRPLRMLPRRVASGDTGSFTAQVSSLDTITANNKPTGTQITFDETYTTSQQMTKGNSQTLTVDLPDNYYLTGLTLSMHSNSKGGAGTLTINDTQIISGTFSSSSWHGSWSQSFVNVVVNNNTFTNLVKNNDVNEFTIVLAATANSLYCESYTLSWGYYEDTNIYHTVSFNALGGGSFDARQVIEGEGAGELPAPTKAKDEENQKRYQFLGWYALSNTDDPANPTFEGATEYTASTPIMSDVTLYAKYQVIDYYKVTFDSRGGSAIATQEIDAGEKASLPAAPTKESDVNYSYTFAGWYREEGCENAYDFDSAVNANTTLFAKWNPSLIPAKQVAATKETSSSLAYSDYQKNVNTTTDTLTRAFTGVTNGATSYSNWSNKTGTSGVKYAGSSAGSNNSIQLRSSDSNSGIVVTGNNTDYYVKSITLNWNNSTQAERVIQIYGKETAYSASSDLYNANNDGDLIVELSIDNATNNELSYAFESDYRFIGIRSKSGAQYLNSIEIEWEKATYTYDNLAIRFSGSIEEELWDRLHSESTITGYGMLLSTATFLNGNDLKDYYELADGSAVKNFDNTDTVHDPALKPTPTLKDGYYVWNLFKRVSLAKATEEYVAVAYIKLNNDEIVFLQQESASVKSLAQDLIAGPNRDESSLGGSLNYLANL